MQIFYGEDMKKEDKEVPSRWTKKSMEAHQRLMKACEEALMGR